MERLECTIVRSTFSSAESGWGVLRAKAKGVKGEITLVGTFGEMGPGAIIEATGEWRTDARFGKQFSVTEWTESLPTTPEALVSYLSSGKLWGVGKYFAKRIVDKFGMDTLDILDNDIERLLEIRNFGKKRLEGARKSWNHHKGVRSVMIFLHSFGVSSTYAAKIYARYGNDSVEVIRANPYQLADEVWGIGFRYADEIAMKVGYGKDDPRRVRSGILFVLTRRSEDGHVFVERESLQKTAASLLGVDKELVDNILKEMIAGEDVEDDGGDIYLPYFYHAEVGAARRLLRLMGEQPDIDFADARKRAERVFRKNTEKENLTFDPDQLKAMVSALTSRVVVLTGGPGTGKTTTVKAIIEAFKCDNKKILLAAPTGRAAKRMTETTGMEARTIHRLLEYTPVAGFTKDEDNPIEGDVLIVDECSMIDLLLFNRLLKAVPATMHLVLVGDIDQLPSVGAGNVLRDVIESERVEVVRLTNIFRQAQSSRIVTNAHAINRGINPDLSNGRDTDFFFIPAARAEQIPEIIVSLVGRRLPDTYKIAPSDIQVLSPMRKGDAGAVNLNEMLQSRLNPEGDAVTRGASTFRRHDKVMQIRNNYEKNVFNGDIGVVQSVDVNEKSIKVNYDGREVEYEYGDLDELTLAYCITIHKSQGSEFPIVVIPVTMQHYVMLQRNLIYTAVTRSKKICVLVGDANAVSLAVGNGTAAHRNGHLKERLNSLR